MHTKGMVALTLILMAIVKHEYKVAERDITEV